MDLNIPAAGCTLDLYQPAGFHLDMVYVFPVLEPVLYNDNNPITKVKELSFWCRNCGNRLTKIHVPSQLLRWRKCPTCGFVFIDHPIYTMDDLTELFKRRES